MSVPSTPLQPGATLSGGVSWFGGPNDPTAGGTTASGKPISAGGIAVYNEATLGGYWRVTFPNGTTTVLQQNDIGPAPWTGRKVDVAYSSLAAAGYNEHDFPTNANVRAEYLGKSPAGGAGSSSSSSSSPATSTATSSAGGKLTAGGLTGLLVKGLIYLALIGGALAMLWLGSKTFLQPRPKVPA